MTTTDEHVQQAQKNQQAFLEDLVGKRLLLPTGINGLFGRSEVFEDVINQFDRLVREAGREKGQPHQATNLDTWRFPPVLSRKVFEKSNYMKSMPQLAGVVHSFDGDSPAHNKLLDAISGGQEWAGMLKMTDVVLTPAACYPVYPTAASQGPLPEGGRTIDILNYCFRHEPSIDPARMQSFRMHEFVRMGTPDGARAWIEAWRERGAALLKAVGLDPDTAPANDPFFGRGGKLMAANQRDQKLKFELLYPITSTEIPTALASFNYHQDHFGGLFGIKSHDGEVAHTACVGFGMERIALALFKTHGLDTSKWPAAVRAKLWPAT